MQSNVNHNTHAVFNFNSNEVRTLEKDNQIWFVLSDVATALDFSHTPHATRMLDDDERSVHVVDTSSENGVEQKREVTIINESGLYSLILKSRKASAKVFKKWVTSEPRICNPQSVRVQCAQVLKHISKSGFHSVTVIFLRPSVLLWAGCGSDTTPARGKLPAFFLRCLTSRPPA